MTRKFGSPYKKAQHVASSGMGTGKGWARACGIVGPPAAAMATTPRQAKADINLSERVMRCPPSVPPSQPKPLGKLVAKRECQQFNYAGHNEFCPVYSRGHEIFFGWSASQRALI